MGSGPGRGRGVPKEGGGGEGGRGAKHNPCAICSAWSLQGLLFCECIADLLLAKAAVREAWGTPFRHPKRDSRDELALRTPTPAEDCCRGRRHWQMAWGVNCHRQAADHEHRKQFGKAWVMRVTSSANHARNRTRHNCGHGPRSGISLLKACRRPHYAQPT